METNIYKWTELSSKGFDGRVFDIISTTPNCSEHYAIKISRNAIETQGLGRCKEKAISKIRTLTVTNQHKVTVLSSDF